jgi:phytoene synthase
LRGAFDALFDIDDAMGRVVATTTQPALAAIKLAWWRDALEALDGHSPPSEPRLQAVANQLLPQGIRGVQVAELEQGWAILLNPAGQEGAMDVRARALFSLAAQLLGVSGDQCLEAAAAAFGAADLRRRGIDGGVLQDRLVPAQPAPRPYRPITAFGALARRDLRFGGPPFEPEATPGRAWALFRHRLTGR